MGMKTKTGVRGETKKLLEAANRYLALASQVKGFYAELDLLEATILDATGTSRTNKILLPGMEVEAIDKFANTNKAWKQACVKRWELKFTPVA